MIIGIGERARSGVPDIYSVWENQGWIAPVIIEEYASGGTILKLSFDNASVKSDRKNRETNETNLTECSRI